MLTDIVMPKMSGRVLAERVSQLRPETQVLYMSGYTDEAVAFGLALEAAAFIEKPFSP